MGKECIQFVEKLLAIVGQVSCKCWGASKCANTG